MNILSHTPHTSIPFLLLLLATAYTSHAMEPAAIDTTCPVSIKQAILNGPTQLEPLLNNRYETFTKEALSLMHNNEPINHYAQELTSLIDRHSSASLLFPLGECSKNCCMSRSQNPMLRERFETRAATILNASLSQQTDKLVTYTTFGCGGAFPDLIILTKALTQKPGAHLSIHMIDLRNNDAVAVRQALQEPHLVIPNPLTLNERYQKIKIALATGKIGLHNIQTSKRQLLSVFLAEYLNHTFASWLHNQFPQARISLFMHARVDHYLTYLQDHGLPHADVLTACDIQDDYGLMKKSAHIYHGLCEYTINKNSSSANLWLDHNHKDAVCLFIISVERKDEHDTEITFPGLPTLYVSSETLQTI